MYVVRVCILDVSSKNESTAYQLKISLELTSIWAFCRTIEQTIIFETY